MAKPLSLDLRKRIVEAICGGMSRSAAAKKYSVSKSCAIKIFALFEQTGSYYPRKFGGPKKPKNERWRIHRGPTRMLQTR